jgi:ribosomal-protein-alanine N-acetyltransferase
MIAKLVLKLNEQRRKGLLLEIRERNMTAQLFFRACGFTAVSVMRDFYEDTDEDAYLFQYKLPVTAPAECEGK